jgi:YbbR domain-containing protein
VTAAAPTRGFLGRLFLDNALLKVVSLVAAMALYSLVRGAEDAQRVVWVEVVAVRDASSDRILLSDIPERVQVTLHGSLAVLNAIRSSDISIQIHLDDTQARILYLDPAGIEVPAGVQITQVTPATIQLNWADRVTRTLPVEPVLDGHPAPGMMLAAPPQVRPTVITLSGPAVEVAALEHVRADPIPVGALEAGRHERRVGLMALPSHSEYREEPVVTVTIEVAPQVAETTLPRLEVAVVGGSVRELRPSRVRVRVRGAPDRLEQIDAQSIVPYVDVTDLSPAAGAQSTPVRVRGIPMGIELLDVEPADVLATPSRN